MKRYPAYKDSGIEWLGMIPESWIVRKLKYSAKINPTKGMSLFSKDSEDQVVFLPMEKVNTDGTFINDFRKPINELWNGFTYFEEDDVIIAKITPCFENGKGAYLHNLGSKIGFGSTEFHVLRERKNRSIGKYLFYITKSAPFRRMGTTFMYGAAGQKRVPSDFIEEFSIGIPPAKEQQAIADFLDRKTVLINDLISKKQRQIELFKEQRQAAINQAVTKGLNPDAKMKDSGIDWLGKIPEHWEVKKLKYLASLKSGDNITSLQIGPEGAYPVYGGNGIRGFTSDFTHDGDYVIFGRQGALCGNVHIASGKFWASEHAVVAHPRSQYNIIWLSNLLQAMNLNQYSISAAQPGLSVERVENLGVPSPSLKEQHSLATYINSDTGEIDTALEKAEKQIQFLQEYRTALISETVTGKIMVC